MLRHYLAAKVGITTTDPLLSEIVQEDWGAQRLVNLFSSWKDQWKHLLQSLGLTSIKELRGRTHLLRYNKSKGNGS